jgi:hypothetical protein
MSEQEKKVDKQTDENKENKPVENNQENEELGYYKSKYETLQKQFEEFKTEFSDVVKQRDDFKSQVTNGEKLKKAELEEIQTKLLEENDGLKAQLKQIEDQKALAAKRDFFLNTAKESGLELEPNALKFLNIDFDKVDVEQPYSAKLLLKELSESMPSIFNSKSSPKPPSKLSSSFDLDSEADELMKNGKYQEALKLLSNK